MKSIYDALAGAFFGATLSSQFKQETGLDLQQDIFSWIGDTAVYVRGSDLAALDGAVVIQATDAAKAKAAVTKIVGVIDRQASGFAPFEPTTLDGAEVAYSAAIPGTPRPVVIAVGKGRVVIAYGEKAATDGLEAGDKLGDTEGFKRAKEALGGKADPASHLSAGPVIKLLEATPDVTSHPAVGKAKPYLETIESVVEGAEKKGDRLRSRTAVLLK